MLRKLFLGLVVVVLTACAVSPGNQLAPSTPAPVSTSPPTVQALPTLDYTQAAPLGSKQAGDLAVSLYCDHNPPIQGANIFGVFVADANNQPVTDAKITYDIDMTNMSHGQYIVEPTSTGAGHYQGKVSFLMPGPWRIIVAIERSGQTSKTRFDFKVKSN